MWLRDARLGFAFRCRPSSNTRPTSRQYIVHWPSWVLSRMRTPKTTSSSHLGKSRTASKLEVPSLSTVVSSQQRQSSSVSPANEGCAAEARPSHQVPFLARRYSAELHGWQPRSRSRVTTPRSRCRRLFPITLNLSLKSAKRQPTSLFRQTPIFRRASPGSSRRSRRINRSRPHQAPTVLLKPKATRFPCFRSHRRALSSTSTWTSWPTVCRCPRPAASSACASSNESASTHHSSARVTSIVAWKNFACGPSLSFRATDICKPITNQWEQRILAQISASEQNGNRGISRCANVKSRAR